MNDLSKVKFKYTGDVVRSQELKKIGTQKLDILIKDMEFQKLKQNRREFRLEDGTIITCLHVFGLSYIEIFSPIYKEEKKEERIKEHFGKWAVITANYTLSLVWDIDNNKMIKLGLKQDMVDFVKKYGYKTTVNDFVDEPSSDHLLEEERRIDYELKNNASVPIIRTNLWPDTTCEYPGVYLQFKADGSEDNILTVENFSFSEHTSLYYLYVEHCCGWVPPDWPHIFDTCKYTVDINGSGSIDCHCHCAPVRYRNDWYSYPVTQLVRNAPDIEIYYKINSSVLQYTDKDISINIGVDFIFSLNYEAYGSYYGIKDEFAGDMDPVTQSDDRVYNKNSTGSISTIGSLFSFGSLTETFMQSETAPFVDAFPTIHSRKSVDYYIKKNDYCCPKYNHFLYMEGVNIQTYHDISYYGALEEYVNRIPYGNRNLEIRACTGKLSKLDLSKRNTALEIAMKQLSDRMVADYGYEYTINSRIIYLVKE